MAWSFRSGIPLTVQIVDKLRSDILRGVYESGSAFPTVRQLATEAGVNPNTMQKALLLLEAEGLVTTRGTARKLVTVDGEVIREAKRRELDKFVAEVVKEAKAKDIDCHELINYIEKGWEL